MSDPTSDRELRIPVRVVSTTRAQAIDAAARAAGWRTGGAGAGVTVTDGEPAPPTGEDAVLALVTDAEAAVAALEAGATHIHALADLAGLGAAIRSAARHVIRLQETRRLVAGGRERRDQGPKPAAWIDARLAEDGALTLVRVQFNRLDLINTAHGRAAGTLVVDAAERRIRLVIETLADDGVLVSRMAGPGFVAAIGGPPAAAIIAAARIEEALARPFRIDGATVVLGSRIGIASARPGDSARGLLARSARGVAQGAGSDDIADPTAFEPIETLAVDLHRALERDEIAVLFQPQAVLATGRIVGVEALARWEHPRLGPLGAGPLLAAAAHAGIELALSERIQRLVLERCSAWPAPLGMLRVSLNLTAADLARVRFGEMFLERLDASGFPRGRLTLEVTETGLMANLGVAAKLLAQLRGAGCRIAIDDFGTGYSSLAYLKALPIDYLKLDKSLAQDIGGSQRDRVVVTGTIDMARSLGIAVIAEGIETEEQRVLLAAAGCALYQGYLLAEPLDEAALIRMVEAQ